MRRRDLLALSVTPALLTTPALAPASTFEDRRRGFRLRESAGLRRFGYPVHLIIAGDLPATSLVLKRDSREVRAQFCRVIQPDGRPLVSLDFNASPGPFAIENYTIHFGEGVAPGPEPNQGMRIQRDGGLVRISNPPHITYTVADDLAGFIHSVRLPELEFMKPDSPGLFVGLKGQRQY